LLQGQYLQQELRKFIAVQANPGIKERDMPSIFDTEAFMIRSRALAAPMPPQNPPGGGAGGVVPPIGGGAGRATDSHICTEWMLKDMGPPWSDFDRAVGGNRLFMRFCIDEDKFTGEKTSSLTWGIKF
jgi:hypothetical protein